MSRKRGASKLPLIPRPLANLVRFLVGPGRTMGLALLMVASFGVAWYWGWQKVRADVLTSASYMLSPDDIVVTDRPEWVDVDIRKKVFQDASLHRQLSIMDPELNERIAAAFSLHPWVARVQSVSKRYPAGVTVNLEYRRPVCMVYLLDQCIPVDREGNVLPKGDIPLNEVLRYPRFECADISTPKGTVGDRWGDARVVGAAEIAAALGQRWETYHLERIELAPRPNIRRPEDIVYELHTRSGSYVTWGRAPGLEVPGDPTTAEKIGYLDRCLEVHGTLEGETGPQHIDLPADLCGGVTGHAGTDSHR